MNEDLRAHLEFFEELGIDSMDGVNIVFALENEFNINVPDEDVKNIRSVRDMVDGRGWP